MGRIFDRFGQIEFHNEAEVSQNFVIPLLNEFLGYPLDEILPEHIFPAFDIPLNREKAISSDSLPAKAKPDYVIAIGGSQKIFVCDSKAPDESLDDHLSQLLAYSIALRVDLLLVTNGTELRVYSANSLVCQSHNIAVLDLSFHEIYKLLGREPSQTSSSVMRIQSLDLTISLNLTPQTIRDEYRRSVAVALSDYKRYLDQSLQVSMTQEMPPAIQMAFGHSLRRFPAEDLYRFQEDTVDSITLDAPPAPTYRSIVNEVPGIPTLLIGESGIGKTNLLRQVFRDQLERCLSLRSDIVPVFVELGLCGRNRGVIASVEMTILSKEPSIAASRIRELMQNGRILLLLDAFDEVLDSQVADVEREIQSIVREYPKCRVIITTRPFRLPRLAPVRRHEIVSLSQAQIEQFAQLYLFYGARDFLMEVGRKGLYGLASNTLLLTLLILLYSRTGELPLDYISVLAAVVEHVRSWDLSKQARSADPLRWDAIIALLGRLAMATLESGARYAADTKVAEGVLARTLDELEERRLVQPGLTVDQVLIALSGTGFISQSDDRVVFWHQAFVEFFALPELAQRLEASPELFDNLVSKPQWISILPSAVARATRPDQLVPMLMSSNIFMAAKAVIELDTADDDLRSAIVQALRTRCISKVQPIRKLAVDLLRQIHGTSADALFLELLQSNHVDVAKIALVEISRRGLPTARDIVFKRLDWYKPSNSVFDGPSTTAVVEALAEFGDEEAQLAIIDIWARQPDLYTAYSCREVLVGLIRRGVFTQSARDGLLELFLSKDGKHVSKHWRIAEVFVALADVQVARRLIAEIADSDDNDLAAGLEFVDVLAAIKDPSIVDEMVVQVLDKTKNRTVRRRFAEILSRSAGDVALEIFQKLAQASDMKVRSHGIRGLGRFAFEKIESWVLDSIHPIDYDDAMVRDMEFAWVQEAAFEVLARHERLELLLDVANRPKYFFDNSAETLCDAVSVNRLISMTPLIMDLTKVAGDSRITYRALWTLADLGHAARVEAIINDWVQKGYWNHRIPMELISGIHRLSPAFALSIIDLALVYDEQGHQVESNYLPLSRIIEALERVATQEAVDRLAKLVTASIDSDGGVTSERALRAIEHLAPKGYEDWLLTLLNEHPTAGALHRMLDTMGVIGTEKSVPTLLHFMNTLPHEYDRTICYWAIHSIYKRAGQLWFNGEEKPIGIGDTEGKLPDRKGLSDAQSTHVSIQ